MRSALSNVIIAAFDRQVFSFRRGLHDEKMKTLSEKTCCVNGEDAHRANATSCHVYQKKLKYRDQLTTT